MVVDGNLQNLHVVTVVLQEFHAFGECVKRHAVTLNCCTIIKIKHAQRRAPIRKPNKGNNKNTSQLVLYECMCCLLRLET